MRLANAGTVLLGFLAGASAGALVAVLTTPKSGRKVRRDLRKFGRKLRDQALDAGGRAWGGLQDQADGLGEEVKRGAQEMTHAVSGK